MAPKKCEISPEPFSNRGGNLYFRHRHRCTGKGDPFPSGKSSFKSLASIGRGCGTGWRKAETGWGCLRLITDGLALFLFRHRRTRAPEQTSQQLLTSSPEKSPHASEARQTDRGGLRNCGECLDRIADFQIGIVRIIRVAINGGEGDRGENQCRLENRFVGTAVVDVEHQVTGDRGTRFRNECDGRWIVLRNVGATTEIPE